MATITLEYDYSDVQAQKTIEQILSLGLFKSTRIGKEDTKNMNKIGDEREKN